MDIRFISSLTADDENQFALALLKALGHLLDQFPIAYTVRIETIGAKVFQHSHPAMGAQGADVLDSGTREVAVSAYPHVAKAVS